VGGFNMTESLVDLLKSKAAGIEEVVETKLLPKWCRQRNLKLETSWVPPAPSGGKSVEPFSTRQ
jgi:hypothetical protein